MFWFGNTKTLLHWKEPSLYRSSQDEVPLYGWLLYGLQSFLMWFLGLHFVLTFGQWLKHGKIGYGSGMLLFTIAAGLFGFAVKLAPVFVRRKILITNQGLFVQDLNGLSQYEYEKIVEGKVVQIDKGSERKSRILEVSLTDGESIELRIPDNVATADIQSVLAGKAQLELVQRKEV